MEGPVLGRPGYPFAEMEKKYRAFSDEALEWSLRDAIEAMRALRHDQVAENWYRDDASTIRSEINRRKRRRR